MLFQYAAIPLPLPVLLLACFVLYSVTLTIYRLFFSPLSKLPGPKLWAASFWPEFYHDVIRRGKWSWEIKAMHKAYGPIIRINPAEIHISDPDYYDTIYAGPTRVTNKYRPAANRFGTGESTFGATDHYYHRRLRGSVAPYFSKQAVSKFSGDIQVMINKLHSRLEGFAGTGQPVDLKYAYIALTADVITEYSFCKSKGALDAEDFDPMLYQSAMGTSEMSHILSQMEWVFPTLKLLPESWLKKMSPDTAVVMAWTESFQQQIRDFLAGKEEIKTTSHPSVFQEIMDNPNMLPSDLTVTRLGREAQTIVSAGYLTTAHTLKVTTFHLLSKPSYLDRLRAEINTVPSDLSPSNNPDNLPKYLSALEQLPFFNAVLTETLRRAYGVPHRLQRIAPNDDLTYGDYVIPKGTPVSMSALDIHDNEDVFPDYQKWKPERWLLSDGKFNHRLGKYIVPFSRGTRSCLGMELAWAELYLAIAGLFGPDRRVEMSLFETDESDVEVVHDFFNPSPKLDSKGVRVMVEKRK